MDFGDILKKWERQKGGPGKTRGKEKLKVA
jgi:hypothetical protein